MQLLSAFAQFLISEWIWSFTGALHHSTLSILLTIMLLIYVAKERMVSAVFYAVCSQLWAVLLFAGIVHLFLDTVCKVSCDVSAHAPIAPLAACFLLGMIYTALQISFFYILRYFWYVPLERYAQILFFSNTLSALIVCKCLV